MKGGAGGPGGPGGDLPDSDDDENEEVESKDPLNHGALDELEGEEDAKLE